MPSLTTTCLESIKSRKTCSDISICGYRLDIGTLRAIANKQFRSVSLEEKCVDDMNANVGFLTACLEQGAVIYGVNTGFGGSADVRSDDTDAVQVALIHLLNAGFGHHVDSHVVRAVLAVRANSVAQGFSGARPAVCELLLDFLRHDVTPLVPLRGSVSASGDLMPTSYIAACMQGRPDEKVLYKGEEMPASDALKAAGLEPITFHAKEALAVVNSSSFAASLGALVLYDANVATLLTQAATALSVEALGGRRESFHPFISKCMPHPGQAEVARNIFALLEESQLAITELEINLQDRRGQLKQDRYALRSAPQWLGPVVETLQHSVRRVTTELNSACDNPLIDHHNDVIVSGANFQGSSIAVAMDHARQAIQMCGKLLFAQMAELVNVTMNNGLPPNLCGSDVTTDFGFKGMETAMASYCSELDSLAVPMTSHVLSAEMGNQGVNSMAFVSARKTQEAVEILQMMLCNIMLAQVQAIDLRWLKNQVEKYLADFVERHSLSEGVLTSVKWWQALFCPEQTAEVYTSHALNGVDTKSLKSELTECMTKNYKNMMSSSAIIAQHLGKGSRKLYKFLREEIHVAFYDGHIFLDKELEKMFEAMKTDKFDDVLLDMF